MTSLQPPKLTVRIVKHDLGEHYLDFLNANNPTGFPVDDDLEIDDHSIVGILLGIALSEGISEKNLKRKAKAIRKISEKAIALHEAFELIARALGYRTWGVLCITLPDRRHIPNLRRQRHELAKKIHSKLPPST